MTRRSSKRTTRVTLYVLSAIVALSLVLGLIGRTVPQLNLLAVGFGVNSMLSFGLLAMVLGVGAGWVAEEFTALNVPFGDRGRRLDEYIAVMRALDRIAGPRHNATTAPPTPAPTPALSSGDRLTRGHDHMERGRFAQALAEGTLLGVEEGGQP